MSELLQKILDQISQMEPQQKALYLTKLKSIIAVAKKQSQMRKGSKKWKKTEKLATILEMSQELNSELSLASPTILVNEFDFEYLDDDCIYDYGDSQLKLPEQNQYKFLPDN